MAKTQFLGHYGQAVQKGRRSFLVFSLLLALGGSVLLNLLTSDHRYLAGLPAWEAIALTFDPLLVVDFFATSIGGCTLLLAATSQFRLYQRYEGIRISAETARNQATLKSSEAHSVALQILEAVMGIVGVGTDGIAEDLRVLVEREREEQKRRDENRSAARQVLEADARRQSNAFDDNIKKEHSKCIKLLILSGGMMLIRWVV